jgi:cellobiose phosphorylase
MSIQQQVYIEAHTTVQLAFITLAGGSRDTTLELASHYQDWSGIMSVFGHAQENSERELGQIGLSFSGVEHFQSLLSLLLYPHPVLRSAPTFLASNSKGQPGLWAFALLGQGDRTGELSHMLNPIYHADTPEKVIKYRFEPYVLAGDVYSTPPHNDRGGWTWYTGSASWMYRLYLEAILGSKKSGNTLRLDATITSAWDGFEKTYHFGKSKYQVKVMNIEHIAQSMQRVKLGGKLLNDRIIPLVDDGREHYIEETMGKK